MESSTLSLNIVFPVMAFLVWCMWKGKQGFSNRRLPPPGPPPLPVLGNIFDIPSNTPWKGYTSLARTYGDIVHLSVFGQSIIILSSVQSITDLLDKRSIIYSDRPRSTMVELMSLDWIFAILPYGETWRKTRRAFYQHFNANSVEEYHHIQVRQAGAFLRHLLASPEGFYRHIRFNFAATILEVIYGIKVRDEDDEYIHAAEEAVKGFNAVSKLGSFYVDFLPFLKYVPAWFPGARFQKQAAYWRGQANKMRHESFNVVKESISSGSATSCVTAALLEEISDGPNRQEEEEIVRDSTGTAYAGGADTIASAIQSFFLAMALHPEAQKKAQAELDAIVGSNRLPTCDDRHLLLYIQAVVMEVLRWQPVAPLGFPHVTSDDDTYRSYYIPKGSVVIANAWAILHDPEAYSEPHLFKPERFLKDGKLNPDIFDPRTVCFGFGRRICPGRHFALNSLFIIVSHVLQVFDLSPGVDELGNPIPISHGVTSEIVSYPVPFSCSIKPRSEAAKCLILESQHD